MRPRERAAFVASYARLLGSVWSDERMDRRLEADAGGVLAEFGFSAPPGATLSVVRRPDGPPDLGALIERWSAGHRTGRFELCVPLCPQVPTQELSESDLNLVSAGAINASSSCCPCCCSL
jgi:hypothetical protein